MSRFSRPMRCSSPIECVPRGTTRMIRADARISHDAVSFPGSSLATIVYKTQHIDCHSNSNVFGGLLQLKHQRPWQQRHLFPLVVPPILHPPTCAQDETRIDIPVLPHSTVPRGTHLAEKLSDAFFILEMRAFHVEHNAESLICSRIPKEGKSHGDTEHVGFEGPGSQVRTRHRRSYLTHG
jgi:hypothetical protein